MLSKVLIIISNIRACPPKSVSSVFHSDNYKPANKHVDFRETAHYLQAVMKKSAQINRNWWWPVMKDIQAVEKL